MEKMNERGNFTLCFLDDYFVAARPSTIRRTFTPTHLGVFDCKNIWLQTYTSFFFDERTGKFRLYVEVPVSHADTEIRKLVMFEANSVEELLQSANTATGVDVTGFEGCVHGSSVYFDKKATDPDKRYIFVGVVNAVDQSKMRLSIAFSANGVDFGESVTIHDDISDTYNSLYYNKNKGEYVVTLRAHFVDRRISIITSKDLKTWSEPTLLLHPEASGNMGLEYYAFGVSEINSIYYGINWRFVTDITAADYSNMAGFMENDLYYGYEGDSFTKSELCPITNRPLPPEYGSKQLWLLNICEDGDRFILCGGAAKISHGDAVGYGDDDKFCATTFYSIRKEGFAAIEGMGKGSLVLTKNMRFDGGDLRLNFNASLGSVSVAVLTPEGKVIEGFSHEDCIPFERCDRTSAVVKWKKANLDSLKGQRIRFEIKLNSALLYSLNFFGAPKFH